ncbi:DMT family transporter [archaeon]|nr:DMT family transporter [archaeon]
MSWLYAILIATVIGGFGKVLHRKVTKDEDVASYSFLFTLVAGFSFIPLFFLEDVTLPQGDAWLYLLAAAFLWFLINITGFNATKRTEVSLYAPLNNLKIIFVLILAVVFLGEAVTVQKILGTIVVFAGAFFLTWKKGSLKQLEDRGVQLVILTAFLTGIVSLFDKYNIHQLEISKSFYGLAMYWIPCALHGFRIIGRKQHMKKIIKNQGGTILITGLIYGVIYYYLFLFAYSFDAAEISVIFPLSQLSIVIALFLGYAWLGEKTDLKKRFVSSLIMIAGAILVALPSII